MRKRLFTQPGGKPTMAAALARIGDDEGLTEVGGDTMLATPIGTTQDGPRMTTSHFGGKTAAPFVKGGGRSKKHPNDAKGKKRAAIKAALAKRKGGDYSNVDLAFGRHSNFDPSEPRGTNGRWIKAAMKAAHAGDLKALKRIQGQAGADYESGHTSYAERNAVMGVRADAIDAKDQTKRGTKKSIARHEREHGGVAGAKQALDKAVLSGNQERIKAAKKALVKAMNKQSRQRMAAAEPMLSNVDLGFFHHDVSKEARDQAGKWAKGGPTWVPEKGARSQAEGKYLAAKNVLAQALLEGDTRKIKKAKQTLVKLAYQPDDAAARRQKALSLAEKVSKLHAARQEGR